MSQQSPVADLYRGFHDHETFTRECLRIRDKSGRTVPFHLQPAQAKLNALIGKIRAEGKPVRIVVLKARQVMISTATAAQFFHRVPFNAGQKALIVAHESKATKNIFGYYEQLQQGYEPFRGVIALPPLKKEAGAAGMVEWENGSYVHVATANNLKSGRSFSLRFLHLSEYAFWRDAKTLMTGLMQSVPDDPDTMVIIESTANGVGGDFYQKWKDACDPTSDSEWVPFFFAWHEHPEYSRPVQDKPRFQGSLTQEEVQLQQRFQLTLEQLHWRRWAIKNKCGGSLDTFKQEYPSHAEEAFLFSGRPRFSHAHLARMPVKTDGLVGELEEFSSGPKRTLQFLPGEKGALVVYKKPVENRRYVIGVDVAEGKDATETGEDPDFSVCCVLDGDTGEQVAKLRGRIEPGPFGEYLAALGRWYNWAYLVPEANGPGIALIEELLRQNYPPALIYHRRPQPDERFASDNGTTLQLLGWRQSTVTRPQLLSKLDMAIREFSLIVADPNTLAELQYFVWKPNGKCEAQDGTHDDEVFAAGLAVVGLETMPRDARLLGLANPQPKKLPASGAVKRYGKRRQVEERRGELLRF